MNITATSSRVMFRELARVDCEVKEIRRPRVHLNQVQFRDRVGGLKVPLRASHSMGSREKGVKIER